MIEGHNDTLGHAVSSNSRSSLETLQIPTALVDVIADLSRQLPVEERYNRLLGALRLLFACDAAALLRLEGEALAPVAVSGLSEETLGRRFALAQHPRLSAILASREPVRFDDDHLPDPYDGLVEGLGDTLPVHDCLGATLFVEEQPWGVLTLDALQRGTFDAINHTSLRTFLRLTEACVRAAVTLDTLRSRLDRELAVNRDQAHRGTRELLGKSGPMRRLRAEITTVAASDLSVLILGETGVGKELVAQQLHEQSQRAERPLVQVNCAALPESLAESELFGHRKGAFTGATEERQGKFELADGGTILLDEVGELPLALQAKLLRVLQNGEIQRPGSDRLLQVNVRVLAATNRDLSREVAEGRFRADLYHRLSVYPLLVPPLRERGSDVITLAGFFLEENRHRLGLRQLRLAAEARAALLAYDWPGNVRELEYLISRATLRATTEQRSAGGVSRWLTLEPRHLDLDPLTAPPPMKETAEMSSTPPSILGATLRAETDRFQREWLQRALDRHHGNIAAAAREAGLDRSNLHRLLKRLGVS